ncbi:MAG TPA: glycosyltransferase family 4 protein, partial [Thermoanaerobaculia bacterium]|nr:glycosyltransferase family 4 protein [Thermoanaerobaculia bacterium]
MLTPLPPARTGVAHYVSLILPTLGEEVDLHPFGSLDGYRRDEYDVVVYQLGNNPFHEFAYREALEQPGVTVLHDIVLHHLIVEMTLARGDAAGYIAALQRNHGEPGAAWARGRAAGLHSEMGNFLLPASVEIANRSRAVVVHNRYAAETLRSLGVTTPIHLAPHPFIGAQKTPSRATVRSRLGIPSDARVVGFFGFLTSAKRAEVVLEAFSRARAEDGTLHLLVVGEAAPNIDQSLFEQEAITVTGYVADEDFEEYYAAADRMVNLRYPTAGETSGTLIRAFAAGIPVAVSDYAQFTEFPDDCVVKVPIGRGEVETLASFFVSPLNDVGIATAQWRWLQENATPEATVGVYLDAIRVAAGEAAAARNGVSARAGVSSSIPLFP